MAAVGTRRGEEARLPTIQVARPLA